MDIGNQIKKRRMELHMTQDELAEKLNVVRTTVSNWEVGRNYPDLQMIVKISDVLDVSLDQLLKGDEALVQQISEDTSVRKIQGKSIRKLKTVIIILAVIIAALLTAFLLLRNSYQDLGYLTDPSEISEAYIGEDDVLHIRLNLPEKVEISSYSMSDMGQYGISNTVGICIHLSKDWLGDGNDLRTSIDEPVYTDADNEEDPGYLLSSGNIAANGIRRICIYYEEVDKENEEIHIHEVYSIDLPNAGK